MTIERAMEVSNIINDIIEINITIERIEKDSKGIMIGTTEIDCPKESTVCSLNPRVISDYNSSSILVVNRKSNLHVDILNALQREKKRLEDKIKSMNDENDYYVADFSGHNI